MRRYLSLNLAALVVFVTIPTAPPWLAADAGVLPAEVSRLTGRGWWGAQPRGLPPRPGRAREPRGRHAVGALRGRVLRGLVDDLSMLRSPWRWSVLAYPLAMGFALVYDAEHYVVDLVGGLLLTTLVMLAWSRWERWRAVDGMPGTEARDG